MSKKKPVTHVTKKDSTTWCGGKKPKDAPFDADACPKCAKLVRASFGTKKATKAPKEADDGVDQQNITCVSCGEECDPATAERGSDGFLGACCQGAAA